MASRCFVETYVIIDRFSFLMFSSQPLCRACSPRFLICWMLSSRGDDGCCGISDFCVFDICVVALARSDVACEAMRFYASRWGEDIINYL